jgi:hypothetical protein
MKSWSSATNGMMLADVVAHDAAQHPGATCVLSAIIYAVFFIKLNN